MQRPSIAGSIFIALFGIPFAAMGTIFAVTALRRGTNMPGVFGAVFGMFFACIGFGLMAASIFGYKKLQQEANLQEANANKPWLWRSDWATGRANGSDPRANITIWVFTAFWDFISIFLSVNVLPKLLSQGDLRMLLVLIFPLAGVFITAMAVRGTLRVLRYGRTYVRLDTVPCIPGSHIRGTIHLKTPPVAAHGFDLRLSCKRKVVTGSGNSRSVTELVLWQAEKNIPAQAVMQGLNGAEVPLDFEIPADAFEANEDNSSDKIVWQLHAEADVPGVNFSDNYEMPIFRTEAASSAAVADAGSSRFMPTFTTVADAQEDPALPPTNTKIKFAQDERGTGFYFPAMRNPGQAFGMLVFASIWSAVVYFLWTHPQVPWLFRIVFSFFEVLVVFILLSVFFGKALIRVREGALEVQSTILGFGALRRLAFDEVSSISPLSQGRADTKGEVLYGINVHKTDGKDINIVQNSLTEAEARWIDSTLEGLMGRKRDSSVRFQSMYGTPPQRSISSGSSETPALRKSADFRVRQRKFGWIGFLIWLAIVAAMFYRFFNR